MKTKTITFDNIWSGPIPENPITRNNWGYSFKNKPVLFISLKQEDWDKVYYFFDNKKWVELKSFKEQLISEKGGICNLEF